MWRRKEGMSNVKCTIQACPGEYADGQAAHVVKKKGQLVIVDHVPADVCSECGDVLLGPTTVRRIEELLQAALARNGGVSVVDYR